MKENNLKKRYITKLSSSIVSGIISAIMVVIVPKSLGPIAYGQFVYLQDFFTKIIGFLDAGSSTAFFTKLSAKPQRKELISFYFLYSFFILAVLFGFVFIINKFSYSESLLPNIEYQYIYLGVIFCFFTWFSQVYIKISDSYLLTVSVEIVKIIQKILSVSLLIFLIYFSSFNLTKYFYFHYLSLLFLFLILTTLFIKKEIFKDILLPFSIKNTLKEFVGFCHPLLVQSFIILLGGIFDIWLLQKIAGTEQVGFYGLSYGLATLSFVFTSAMTPLIIREFSSLYESKDLIKIKELLHKYLPMLYSIAAYFSVFISLQSQNIIAIFVDDKFEGAYLALAIMAYYPIHQTYGQITGGLLYSVGQTKLVRNLSFLTVPLGMILSYLFIYSFNFGAVGLAYKMIIVQIIGVNIQLMLNAKILGIDMFYFIKHQIFSVLFFVVIAYGINYFIHLEGSIINFIVSGMIYTTFVIIGNFFFPQVFFGYKNLQ